MDSRIITFLKQTVGESDVSDHLIDLVTYSSDASEFRHRPEVAVFPTETAHVVAIMEMADREKIAVTPRGAGTNLSGLAVPVKGGIVLDFIRMNKILNISLENRWVVVQPGVVYAKLEQALKPSGFAFPPDPASGLVATLGGNVATNAGGVKGAKYGTTRDYVLGLEAVLPGGKVLRTGSKTMKCVSGFDLTKLLVGSEGLLGVITEITLKICPRPRQSTTAMAVFESIGDAGRAVSRIMTSGLTPSVLEIVEYHCIRAINANTRLDLPEVEAILLAETDGNTVEETRFQMNAIIDIFNQNGATKVQIAQSDTEAEALWSARKSAYPVVARLNNTVISEDTTVPISKVAQMLEAIKEVGQRFNLIIPTVGHVGDGNIHPHFSYDRTDADQVKKVQKARAELYQKAITLGGTLTGEHGIGLGKAPFMRLEHSPVAMSVMKTIKHAFDPNNILNPGKMDLDACKLLDGRT